MGYGRDLSWQQDCYLAISILFCQVFSVHIYILVIGEGSDIQLWTKLFYQKYNCAVIFLFV